MKKIQSDLLAVNVSWFLEDLELYENPYGFLESFSFTAARLMTLIMAIIVHRAFYKVMKRLPGRAVNQIIYPYMVRYHFRNISIQYTMLVQDIFQDSEGTIGSAEINDTSYKTPANFHGDETKKNLH